jgi:hypothetical protein
MKLTFQELLIGVRFIELIEDKLTVALSEPVAIKSLVF